MKENHVLACAAIALAAGELMVTARRLTARRLTARLPRLNGVSTQPGRRRGRRGARGRRRDLAEHPLAARDVMVTPVVWPARPGSTGPGRLPSIRSPASCTPPGECLP